MKQIILEKEKSLNKYPAVFWGKIMNRLLPETHVGKITIEPDIVIGDTFSLGEYGIDGEVIHTPGHTAGSLAVVLSNGQAVVGDSIEGPAIMNMWRVSYPTFAEDIEDLRRSYQRLMKYPLREIYNAHGKMITLKDIKKLLGSSTSLPVS